MGRACIFNGKHAASSLSSLEIKSHQVFRAACTLSHCVHLTVHMSRSYPHFLHNSAACKLSYYLQHFAFLTYDVTLLSNVERCDKMVKLKKQLKWQHAPLKGILITDTEHSSCLPLCLSSFPFFPFHPLFCSMHAVSCVGNPGIKPRTFLVRARVLTTATIIFLCVR